MAAVKILSSPSKEYYFSNDVMDINNSSDDDSDSIFSIQTSSSASSFTRTNSHLANYRYENNRRYQSYREGNWLLPNDEQEQDRMQIVDTMLSLLLDGELHLSPLSHPRRILDVGTGTGVWASDMAYKFPNTRVIGTDLSPIQVATPDNCTFEIEDADDNWLYPPNYFSMVHTRNLLGGITNWKRFFDETYRSLHPNGWLELHESPYKIYSNNPAYTDIPLMRTVTLFSDISARLGRVCGEEVFGFKALMEAAGFVDVTETRYRLPIGTWPDSTNEKEIGRYNLLNCLDGIEGFALAIVGQGENIDPQEMMDEARKDILNKRARLYTTFIILRGRKPAACEVLPAQR
ncbi:Similar to Demethylmenaquinone methyltransferase; acc. no. Q9RRT0 [Pyronema omphalodes CBS 100304]|uniref:Similar to Demethylmenaquinone methyltransferase acc. no. Q9RRT0 n=1 Tax=Pyronema omphalodes (strain CBS 100304) TaxID=1076935 RepID=U4LAV1_PYROM|nr:Similar to Demethylmenaquinone methyltransferase; acc. no. Q9RRT0 [Pyronema omphalodes CBS 100304]